MKASKIQGRASRAGWLALAAALCGALALIGGSGGVAQAGSAQRTPNVTCPAGQCFTDVPPANPFFTYVNNLYLDSIISGYACGGPGELCDPDNRPYYRPNNNVTRQQMSKFVDNGRRLVTGAWEGGNGPDYGIFSAINTDISSETNVGLYGSGATGVGGESHTSGTAIGYAGYFHSLGGGTASQYGVYALANSGTAVYGESDGTVVAGTGGQFVGYTGAVITGHGATPAAAGDGLDVGAAGGLYNAIYSTQPAGNTNYTLYGQAHIHGSNIAAGEYEQEAVYDGATPLPLGRVVALDPANLQGGPLGVVAANADNADAAIGVVSYRLDTAQVNGVDKTYIDPAAKEVHSGDRIYITFAGRVKMKLAGQARVGTRLAVGQDGTAVIALSNGSGETFGKVASQSAADGTVDVIVSFK
jgi:hypothetical protein